MILLWFAWHVVAPAMFILALLVLVILFWMIRKMVRLLK
jgi:hypothetical protein